MQIDNQEKRYDCWHQHNKIRFYLSDFNPDAEECKILIFKIIEQVMRDFILLKDVDTYQEKLAWHTASSFIFDNDYYLMWGDMELSAEDFMGIVNIEIEWLRKFAQQKSKQLRGYNGKKER